MTYMVRSSNVNYSIIPLVLPLKSTDQEWEVSESYELRDCYLKERGAIKCSYRPQDYPELPFEVAKMGKGTEENVIKLKWE